MATEAISRWQRLLLEKHYVYALCVPCEFFSPRYVGVTVNVRNRLDGHISRPKTKELGEWLSSIKCKPRVAVLEESNGIFDGRSAEQWWILHLLSQGHDLLNKTSRRDSDFEFRMQNIRRDAARRIRRMFSKRYHSQKTN